jgi:hypothetical protein
MVLVLVENLTSINTVLYQVVNVLYQPDKSKFRSNLQFRYHIMTI